MTFPHYGALIGLGLVAAAVGVGAMRVAALIERAFRAAIPWRLVRPPVGGLMVGAMALYTPQVLGAGHGALGLDFYSPMTAAELAILIVLKLFACLVSLASGFRGGLFFASLFVGSLLGKLYAIGIDAVAPSMDLETTACVLVGMGALSAAIVGGPLTMTFLVLESTGNLGVAGGVLAASIATSLAVRATFGYSFTTWRLHLRGETIRGGQDVGWLRDLTVGRMMVRSPPVFPAEGSVRKFREAYPLGSANVVVAVGEGGRYQGLIHVPEAHALSIENGEDGGPVAAIVHLPRDSAQSRRRHRNRARGLRRRSRRHARRHRARNRAGAGHAWRSLRRAPLRAGDESGDEGGAGRRVGSGLVRSTKALFLNPMDAVQKAVEAALEEDIERERQIAPKRQLKELDKSAVERRHGAIGRDQGDVGLKE